MLCLNYFACRGVRWGALTYPRPQWVEDSGAGAPDFFFLLFLKIFNFQFWFGLNAMHIIFQSKNECMKTIKKQT